MPQYRMKFKQTTAGAGKEIGFLGDLYNSSGVKQGPLKLITKGQNNAWPGADWVTTIGPGHAMVQQQKVEEEEQKEYQDLPNRPQEEEHNGGIKGF